MPLDQTMMTRTNGPSTEALPELSKRQQEILAASAFGSPDKVIADQLQISTRTLEGHWRAIHRKLGSLNRCQAGFLFAALRENPHGNARA
jgi:NarL family two-component system response regulator LiaR